MSVECSIRLRFLCKLDFLMRMLQSSMEDDVTTPLISQSEKYGRINDGYSAITPDKSSIHDTSGAINEGELSSPDRHDLPQDSTASKEQEIKVYKRRWCILLFYSLLCFTNSMVWNTWSPISNSVKKAFDWTNGDISLLANWGPITKIVVPIFAWMLDAKGLRWSVVISVLLITLGAGVRIIPTTQPSNLHKWLIHIGQILNGLGGPVTTVAMPALSATWFPPHERATATAIPLMTKFIALAGSFIVGPLLVPDIPNQNGTDLNVTTNWYENQYGGNNSNSSGVTNEELKKDVTFYLRLQAGVAGVVCLLILVYFPKKPPSPPCVSASVQRKDFLPGLKFLLRKGNFWIMVLIAVLVCGFNNTWTAVLSLIVIPSGASQREAGWIGFYALLSVAGGMLIVGRLGDFFARRMKLFISSLYIIAAAMYLWFTLICLKIVPYHIAFLYVSIIVGQTATNAPFPLVLELACELAYPVGEGTSSGIVNGAFLLFCAGLLFVMMIPHIGTMWINYSFVAAMALSTVLVLIVKEKHHRLEIDTAIQSDDKQNIQESERQVTT